MVTSDVGLPRRTPAWAVRWLPFQLPVSAHTSTLACILYIFFSYIGSLAQSKDHYASLCHMLELADISLACRGL